jgi:hypothetical protein
LKRHSILEERRQRNKEIREALKKRCADLQTNQRRVIQVLTNSYRDRIVIDRMKTKESGGEDFITTSKEDIFNHIKQYYQEAFRKRTSGFEQFSDDWKEQYQPKDFIENSWYNPLSERISIIELEAVIKQLPNKKAAGPSGIKYEMLKNLGEEGLAIFTELLNLFLIKGSMPSSWKESLLYPISKGKDWKCELSNT